MRIYLYSVSQKDGDTIGAMIKCTGCLDFQETMIFHALQEETAHTVQSLLRSIDDTIMSKRIETYTYICADDTLLNCELPVGYQCAPITQNLKILDQENLKKNFIKESKLEAMREAINLGQPTLCVYNKDGDPVAWASKKIYGFVGGLFTVEKHRRKGLGQYVYASMTKMVLEKDGQALSSIERDNYISIKLHEKLGFKRCPDSMSYVWIECL